MSVFRIERTKDYTVMSNCHSQRQKAVPESKRSVISDAVLTRRLGLHPLGSCLT